MEYQKAVEACSAESRDAISNPADDFYLWMLKALEETDDRAKSDDRYRAVLARFSECMNQIGLKSMKDEADVANAFAKRQNSILDEAASPLDALASLRDLASEEERLVEPLNSCVSGRDQALQGIKAGYEDKWIEDNGDAVKEEIGRLGPLVREFDETAAALAKG